MNGGLSLNHDTCGIPTIHILKGECKRHQQQGEHSGHDAAIPEQPDSLSSEPGADHCTRDRKSTRLNSSHVAISYAVFCLKKKKKMSTVCSLVRQRRKRERPRAATMTISKMS